MNDQSTLVEDVVVPPGRDIFNELMQGIKEMSSHREVCQLQKFMESEALNRSGVQTGSKPLFISCPCKRCSPFTL